MFPEPSIVTKEFFRTLPVPASNKAIALSVAPAGPTTSPPPAATDQTTPPNPSGFNTNKGLFSEVPKFDISISSGPPFSCLLA